MVSYFYFHKSISEGVVLEVEVKYFWATVFALCYRTVVCPACLSSLSVTLVYCGQTVGWIRMPLGIEVGLGQGHCVRLGPSSPMERGTAAPPLSKFTNAGFACVRINDPCLLWSNGWMDQDATLYGGGPRPRPHCVRWGPSFPHQKRAQQPPTFRPMSIVARRSPISAIRLSCCC